MDCHFHDIYIQCIFESALNAHWSLVNFERMLAESRSPRDIQLAFTFLDRFLVESSRVSRYLWPGSAGGDCKEQRKQRKQRADDRGRALVAALGMTADASHALKNRKLRDHLEHADERLDDWVQNSLQHNHVDLLVSNINMAVGGTQLTDVFRQYDPQARKFIFRGEVFDIFEMAKGVDDIVDRTSRYLDINWLEAMGVGV